MTCSQCGANLPDGAAACPQCGRLLSSAGPGASTPATPAAPAGTVAIWNPNAAANWSIVFTPAFGSYLQALNWRALGETRKEKKSKGWFYFSLALLALYLILGLFVADTDKASSISRGVAFLFLIIWYFAVGRSQAKFVKQRLGANYQHRPWGKPLLVALALSIALLFIVGIPDFLAGFRAGIRGK